jgi:hypothetical protein
LKAKNFWSVVRPEGDATSSVTATDGGTARDVEEEFGGNQTATKALKAEKAVGIIVASLGDKPLQAVLSVQDNPREIGIGCMHDIRTRVRTPKSWCMIKSLQLV